MSKSCGTMLYKDKRTSSALNLFLVPEETFKIVDMVIASAWTVNCMIAREIGKWRRSYKMLINTLTWTSWWRTRTTKLCTSWVPAQTFKSSTIPTVKEESIWPWTPSMRVALCIWLIKRNLLKDAVLLLIQDCYRASRKIAWEALRKRTRLS